MRHFISSLCQSIFKAGAKTQHIDYQYNKKLQKWDNSTKWKNNRNLENKSTFRNNYILRIDV